MRDRAVIGVGLGAGLAGISIIFVLDVTGYLAFGHVPGSGSLLASIQQTPPWRRVLALVVAGVIGGVGWYLLRRRGTQIVSDEDAVSGSRMPALKTIMDGLLQMAVIGLGASTAASSHPGRWARWSGRG